MYVLPLLGLDRESGWVKDAPGGEDSGRNHFPGGGVTRGRNIPSPDDRDNCQPRRGSSAGAGDDLRRFGDQRRCDGFIVGLVRLLEKMRSMEGQDGSASGFRSISDVMRSSGGLSMEKDGLPACNPRLEHTFSA